jgi:hypothetical protein
MEEKWRRFGQLATKRGIYSFKSNYFDLGSFLAPHFLDYDCPPPILPS